MSKTASLIQKDKKNINITKSIDDNKSNLINTKLI